MSERHRAPKGQRGHLPSGTPLAAGEGTTSHRRGGRPEETETDPNGVEVQPEEEAGDDTEPEGGR